MFLTLDIHLLDMLRVFSKIFAEIFDLPLKNRCIVLSISRILKENNVILGLD